MRNHCGVCFCLPRLDGSAVTQFPVLVDKLVQVRQLIVGSRGAFVEQFSSDLLFNPECICKVVSRQLFAKGGFMRKDMFEIIIERPHKKCRVTIHAARPGLVIGKKGADIEKLRGDLAKMTKGEVALNIVEIHDAGFSGTTPYVVMDRLDGETLADVLRTRGKLSIEELVDIYFGGLIGAKGGLAAKTPMAELEKIVREPRFTVTIDLNLGTANYVVYTSDLSEEYVDFNAAEYNAAVHSKRQKGFS